LLSLFTLSTAPQQENEQQPTAAFTPQLSTTTGERATTDCGSFTSANSVPQQENKQQPMLLHLSNLVTGEQHSR